MRIKITIDEIDSRTVAFKIIGIKQVEEYPASLCLVIARKLYICYIYGVFRYHLGKSECSIDFVGLLHVFETTLILADMIQIRTHIYICDGTHGLVAYRLVISHLFVKLMIDYSA